METIHHHFYNHVSQAVSPIKHQQTLSTSDSAFPILAIAVLSIMAIAFILVCYYIFVIKCCMNWHQISLLRRFSNSQARQSEDSLLAYSPTLHTRGLDESFIRELPTFQFKKGEEGKDRSLYECVVCLNEFQQQDMLRVLPNCSHAFHLDCIDIWLQSSANCPLCRSSISGAKRCPLDQILAPSSSPQGSQPYTNSIMGSDEDFVVIELMEEHRGAISLSREQDRDDSREGVQRSRFSPRKLEQKFESMKPRKLHNVSSMGDECINVREKDDHFSIQPLRRSFSMDSASDRQLCLSVQAILRQNRNQNEVSTSEECSSRVRRSFFPFGYGRGSKSAVLPIEFEL